MLKTYQFQKINFDVKIYRVEKNRNKNILKIASKNRSKSQYKAKNRNIAKNSR